MDIEEAIEYLKNYKYDNEVRQAIDTVLNYIEELEKQNENYKKYAVIMSAEGLLINGVKFSFNDYIPKQKIRAKIRELEEMKLDNDDVFGQMRNYTVLVLKEILGEDEK